MGLRILILKGRSSTHGWYVGSLCLDVTGVVPGLDLREACQRPSTTSITFMISGLLIWFAKIENYLMIIEN